VQEFMLKTQPSASPDREFVDALPRNPAGKVLKYQLAAQLTASPQG
jgi:acyl-coenzyme A synthetase/AMP-(fatty) acid ligase